MATAYDEVPYANLPFAQTRPEVLATVATLHGLAAPDPTDARVLELGCGAGANLLGIAAARPSVRALGVDLAPTAIERARSDAVAAGLRNVDFDVADVRDLTDGRLGAFDYVVVHGLYAWADEALREAVLAACRAHLAPDGLAYVSYTAHPGGHLRSMLREMAQWHAREAADRVERAERARELFTMLDGLGGPRTCRPSTRARSRTTSTRSRPGRRRRSCTTSSAPTTRRSGSPTSRRPSSATGSRTSPTRCPRRAGGRRGRPSSRRGSPRLPAGIRSRASSTSTSSSCGAFASRSCATQAAPYSRTCGRQRYAGCWSARWTRAPRRSPSRASTCPRASSSPRSTGARSRSTSSPPPGVAAPGERPLVSGLARSQAVPGALVTTLRNQVVRLTDEPTAALIALLDGSRDRAAIARDFPGPLTEEALEAALGQFGRLGLLLA